MAGENSYPNEFNYPRPSFPQPVPAPDVDPDEGELLAVAYNPAWQPVLEGALMQLLLPSTYIGDHDAKILALNRAETLRLMLTEPIDEPVPTPYWDEATDLDDELPASTQTWYGIFDGTFQETVENFVIAGFIAATGEIGGAVFFLTIAPKFRLAWKTGDLGGIIRVFIDAADAGTVDTYSPTEGIIERDYVGDPEVEEHEILIVLEDTP